MLMALNIMMLIMESSFVNVCELFIRRLDYVRSYHGRWSGREVLANESGKEA
jgi:hypothetical protein